MIKLYVDDERQVPEGWVLARTIEEAKRHLSAGVVEYLSLDHDMGLCQECLDNGRVFCPDTHLIDGTALVHWIIETGNWPAQKPVVHSANPIGATRMRGMIDRYWTGDDR